MQRILMTKLPLLLNSFLWGYLEQYFLAFPGQDMLAALRVAWQPHETLPQSCSPAKKHRFDILAQIKQVKYGLRRSLISTGRRIQFPLEQVWAVNLHRGAHEKLGLLWKTSPISWTQFCSILILSPYKLIGVALHNSPNFSCDPLGRLIVHQCFRQSQPCGFTRFKALMTT